MSGNDTITFSLDDTVIVGGSSHDSHVNNNKTIAPQFAAEKGWHWQWLREFVNKKKLMFCTTGIFVCYFCYGILQEKITKGTYGEHKEKFQFMLALVCVQCLVNAIYAKFAMFFHAKERDVTPSHLYIFCSFSYLGAMLASNHALQYISYPTQVIGKSVKPIPVMIMGVLLAGKRYSIAKYLCILLIVGGVALFIYKDQYSSHTDDSHTYFGIGEILLLVSLTLDGFTGASQDKMRSNHKTGANSMMLNVNLFSVLLLTFGLIITNEIFEFVSFVRRYPIIIFSLTIFSLVSALGQMFIFITVTSFGPLTCSVVTTTRKFFTILASILIFQNPISRLQWVAILLVFMGIGLDSVYGKEITRVI